MVVNVPPLVEKWHHCWLLADSNGRWCVYAGEPRINDDLNIWSNAGVAWVTVVEPDKGAGPCPNWRDTLEQVW